MNSVVFQEVACFNLSWQKEVNLPSFGDFGGLVSENYLALGNRLLLKFQVLKYFVNDVNDNENPIRFEPSNSDYNRWTKSNMINFMFNHEIIGVDS